MVVWLECLGPLQLPGSAHRYLQVIKKPSDSSEELQSISNEAGSSNGIKSRTIASTKETARFARRCWTPNLCGWFSHIFHPRNAHESMIAGSKPLSIIISYESEYPIISLYLPMRSPWNHPKPWLASLISQTPWRSMRFCSWIIPTSSLGRYDHALSFMAMGSVLKHGEIHEITCSRREIHDGRRYIVIYLLIHLVISSLRWKIMTDHLLMDDISLPCPFDMVQNEL